MKKQNLDVKFDEQTETITEKPLDIPEFLKGQTKEYIRMEKDDYRLMIQNFNQARHMAYMRGIATGAWLIMIIGLLIVLTIVGVQHFSFGTLPMAGP